MKNLDFFFYPKTVAVIGASATPRKIGYEVFRALIENGFKGEVIPINPFREEILGVKTEKELIEIKKQVDLVIQVVDFKKTPELLLDAHKVGTKAYIVISGGGKETGLEDVTEIEAKVNKLANKLTIPVIGPNCIGVFSGETRIDTFFHPIERMLRAKKGNYTILAQSGTYGVALLEEAARVDLGVNKFFSYGNKVDIDEIDMLDYLVKDENTKVVSLYLEALGENKGREFFRAVKEFTTKKPLLITKSCKTQKSAKASLSHTGWFGGSWEVFKGVILQTGGILLDTVDEHIVSAKTLISQITPNLNRVAMVSNGAGPMLAAIDRFEDANLELANLSNESIQILEEEFPPFFTSVNPVDVTGSATDEDYAFTIRVFQDDPNVDIIMPWFVMQDSPLDLNQKLINVLRESSLYKPIICGAMGADFTDKKIKILENETDVPFAKNVDSWVAAAKSLYIHAKNSKH